MAEFIKSLVESAAMKATISGIRGVTGTELGIAEVVRFCRGFADTLHTDTCVVGQDSRSSGRMLSEVASCTMAGCGINVIDLGEVPTPVLFREARGRAGIMITASHNPVDWNGLKFVVDGRIIDAKQLNAVMGGQAALGESYGTMIPDADATNRYISDVVDVISGVADTSVLVDAGGGAARYVAGDLLRAIGCSVDEITPDVPRPDPTAGGLDDTIQKSLSHDMAVIFDMDGDRMVLARDGRILAPDATLALGVMASMDMGERVFVVSADTSVLVERYITERGGKVYRSSVGEGNVVDAILHHRAGAGGEGSSAGFILPSINWCRDGLLSAALATSDMERLDIIQRDFEGTHIIRQKVRPASRPFADIADELYGLAMEVDMTDGVRATLDESSWVLIRHSNTEDITRISAEAPTAEACRRVVKRIEGMLHE